MRNAWMSLLVLAMSVATPTAAQESAPADVTVPGTSPTESAAVDTAEFSVDGMTCGGCAIATEMSVKKLEGVRSVDAGFDEESGSGWCTVSYDPGVLDTGTIAGAIRDAGFEPTLQSTSDER